MRRGRGSRSCCRAGTETRRLDCGAAPARWARWRCCPPPSSPSAAGGVSRILVDAWPIGAPNQGIAHPARPPGSVPPVRDRAPIRAAPDAAGRLCRSGPSIRSRAPHGGRAVVRARCYHRSAVRTRSAPARRLVPAPALRLLPTGSDGGVDHRSSRSL